MRTWTVAATDMDCCGFCWASIKKGEPMQEIDLQHLGIVGTRARCVLHADEPVDEKAVAAARARLNALDQPAPLLPVPSGSYRYQPSRMVPFSDLDESAFDSKLAASGDD